MSGLRIPLEGPDGAGTDHTLNLLAPNPSEMTLDGTNTWVIGLREAAGSGRAGSSRAGSTGAGSVEFGLLEEVGEFGEVGELGELGELGEFGEEVLVVDPGPDDDEHLARVAERLEGRRVVAVLLTHGHHDHSGGAAKFAGLVGAPVRALDPAHRLGEEGLGDGDVITAGDLELHVVGTPGHSFDSLCFWLPRDRAILTGDTVLGRGTTMIAPDGDLADYLRSLDLLRARAERVGAEALLPGHGPVLPDPIGALDGYIAHRRRRLDQIREARRRGAATPREVVEIVYADVDRALWPAAEMSVRAQLAYLDG